MPTAAPSPPPLAAGRERKGGFHHMLFGSRDLFTHGTSPWGSFDQRAFSICLKCNVFSSFFCGSSMSDAFMAGGVPAFFREVSRWALAVHIGRTPYEYSCFR